MNDFTLKYTILIYFIFYTIINKNDFFNANFDEIKEHYAEEPVWKERAGGEEDFDI